MNVPKLKKGSGKNVAVKPKVSDVVDNSQTLKQQTTSTTDSKKPNDTVSKIALPEKKFPRNSHSQTKPISQTEPVQTKPTLQTKPVQTGQALQNKQPPPKDKRIPDELLANIKQVSKDATSVKTEPRYEQPAKKHKVNHLAPPKVIVQFRM